MFQRLACVVLLAAAAAAQESAGGFSGVVRDLQGKPVAGAWVEVRPATSGALDARDFEGPPRGASRTAADGAYSFKDLDAGAWIVTAVEGAPDATDAELGQLSRPIASGSPAPSRAITRILRRLDTNDAPRDRLVDLVLASGATTTRPVKGRLVGPFTPGVYGYEISVLKARPEGLPVRAGAPGVQTMSFSSHGNDYAITTVPGVDGTYDFGNLDIGSDDMVQVEAFKLDGPETVKATVFQPASLPDDRPVVDVDVPLLGHGAIALRIVSADGGTADSIALSLWGDSGNSVRTLGSDSRFEALMTEGTYVARASGPGLASPLVTFRVPAPDREAEVLLTLQPCPPLNVTFVDQHGAPLAVTTVRLGPPSLADDPRPCRVSSLCKDGVAEFKSVLPGRYLVEFKLPQGEPFRRELELVADGAPVTVTVP